MSARVPVPPERKVIMVEYPVCVPSVGLTVSFRRGEEGYKVGAEVGC
jgi:hypothetical protein